LSKPELIKSCRAEEEEEEEKDEEEEEEEEKDKMQWDKFLRLENSKIYYNIGTKLDYVYCK
jgi:hypothetical protein